MELEVTLEEVVAEMDRVFNKELTICVQNLQIQKLQELIPQEEDGDREEEEE